MSKTPSQGPRREPDFEPSVPPLKKTVYMELGDERDRANNEASSRLIHGELKPDEVATILVATLQRVLEEPTTALTREEASILYEVDQELPKQASRLDSQLRVKINLLNLVLDLKDLRGEQDSELVKGLIIERMRGEKNVMQTAQALKEVTKALGLNEEEYSSNVYMHALVETMQDWEQRGVFEFLTHELIVNNTRYDIVPVPNKEFTYQQLFHFADQLDEGKAGLTLSENAKLDMDELFSQYAPKELCGESTNDPIRLRLIPNRINTDISYALIQDQRIELQSMQLEKPELNLQVPSVLESVAQFYVLRAGGLISANISNMISTSTRHFDLDPRALDDDLFIPVTYVADAGEAVVYFSTANRSGNARLSIG